MSETNDKTTGAPRSLYGLVGLLESAQKLNEIVEGVSSRRWAADNGFRLKDTSEWCEFYVSLKRAEREQANATGERPETRSEDA